jgi:hypothetical protein
MPPSWVYNYPAGNFTHLIYAALTSEKMTNAVILSGSKNAGFLYFAIDVMENSWDSLPTYWKAELSTIATKCRL